MTSLPDHKLTWIDCSTRHQHGSLLLTLLPFKAWTHHLSRQKTKKIDSIQLLGLPQERHTASHAAVHVDNSVTRCEPA